LRARFFLATALENKGETELALNEYRTILKMDPNNLNGNLGLGVLLFKVEGDGSVEASNALKRVVSINANIYEAQVSLGKSLVRQKLYQEAIAHLLKAAELKPDNPEPHYQLALAYRRLGKRKEAKRSMEIVKAIHEKRRGAPGKQ
jgi:Flp pilus assembly protein TadD